MNERMKWWIDLSTGLTFVITLIVAAIGVFGYLKYRFEFRQKSKRLEEYLRNKKEEDKKKGKKGQRRPLNIVRHVGLTSDEIVNISFHNPRVGRRNETDPITKKVTGLLFVYQEPGEPSTPDDDTPDE